MVPDISLVAAAHRRSTGIITIPVPGTGVVGAGGIGNTVSGFIVIARQAIPAYRISLVVDAFPVLILAVRVVRAGVCGLADAGAVILVAFGTFRATVSGIALVAITDDRSAGIVADPMPAAGIGLTGLLYLDTFIARTLETRPAVCVLDAFYALSVQADS
jgi:hypothetical protein